MAKMNDGPGKTALIERGVKVSQRRKGMYERHRERLQSSCCAMEQAAMTMDMLQNLMTTMGAMKAANKEMRRLYGKFDPNKLERYRPRCCQRD
jgi:charged multivesicular body protein 5